MELNARAERSGSWWAVEVPEIEGLYTQVKRLDQVEAMVRDAASALTGQPGTSFSIKVVPVVDTSTQEALKQARDMANAAAEAQRQATALNRDAAHAMRASGMSVRDIGTVMHVSFQRASQILKGA
ncbi:hypothetical protein ACFRJ9_05630 [Paenarthrobacter sp. NPDC056912]|uniref:hypothetical protein n=1 Tax=Paenarthrobacter sp. NPDC056912 TaxID=3345965 RepID=UPI003672019B